MAVGVVDLLEVVDVDDEHRHARALAARQLYVALQGLVEGGAVLRAGQRVAEGALDGEAVDQGVAQGVDQRAEQVLELAELRLCKGVEPKHAELAEPLLADDEVVTRAVQRRVADLDLHVRAAVLVQDAVELDAPAQLAREELDQLVDLERRLQRAGQLQHLRPQPVGGLGGDLAVDPVGGDRLAGHDGPFDETLFHGAPAQRTQSAPGLAKKMPGCSNSCQSMCWVGVLEG